MKSRVRMHRALTSLKQINEKGVYSQVKEGGHGGGASDNPLHHFELNNIVEMSLGGVDISINQAVVVMWIVVFLIAALFLGGRKGALVPSGLQNLVELGVELIHDMAIDNIGPAGKKYVPLLITIFFFVLFCNLVGMIPGSFTVTSQIFVTGMLAMLVYGHSLVVGFGKHGLKFFKILVPEGTPGWLIPAMIPIEILSQLARPVSLAVRLFANMTAGHVILTVLFSMAVGLPLWIGWLPFGFTVAINGMEVLIAFIQAYIFVMLSCVYLADAEHLGH